ncbi:DUF6975 family protein [Sphingomonas sp. CCH5-D11]|uniref:DUF6975 family protein n=1 Tax=Sphingomonas sp. CCH5-D11 TaxID=1768786 RepID=UPI000832945D|nr:hypothetical protein [Sphingomonas sp. CCH5-D11]
MASNAGVEGNRWSLDQIVDREGTLSCNHAVAICTSNVATRDLADAVHALCQLHGSAPGIVELASRADSAASAIPWLAEAAAVFDQERNLLITLTAAVGPIPSTPRHAQSEAAISAQRHALGILAQSSRAGCAIGAALALLLEWHAIRQILTAAARRTGVALLPHNLPTRDALVVAAQSIATNPAHGRALAFGAEQLALQHHGLWQLLASRAEARNAL